MRCWCARASRCSSITSSTCPRSSRAARCSPTSGSTASRCASSACISIFPACGGGGRRRRSSPISHERDGEPPTVLMGDLNEWSTRGGCLRDFARGSCISRPAAAASTPGARSPRSTGSWSRRDLDDRRQRRPPHRRLAPRLRSSADLGRASARPTSQAVPPSTSPDRSPDVAPARAVGRLARRLSSSSQSRNGRR